MGISAPWGIAPPAAGNLKPECGYVFVPDGRAMQAKHRVEVVSSNAWAHAQNLIKYFIWNSGVVTGSSLCRTVEFWGVFCVWEG